MKSSGEKYPATFGEKYPASDTKAAFLDASWQMLSGTLHPGRFEEYPQETPKRGCRGAEGGLWE